MQHNKYCGPTYLHSIKLTLEINCDYKSDTLICEIALEIVWIPCVTKYNENYVLSLLSLLKISVLLIVYSVSIGKQYPIM